MRDFALAAALLRVGNLVPASLAAARVPTPAGTLSASPDTPLVRAKLPAQREQRLGTTSP